MTQLRRFLVLAVATCGFVTYIPHKIVPGTKWKGAGLWGSLVGILLARMTTPAGVDYWTLLAAILAVSLWTGGEAEKYLESHDDPRIVIDEVAGVFLASAFFARSAENLVFIFIFFRIFDVFKGPWGKWAAKAPGGWGVVADDLVAGVIAQASIRALNAVFPSALSLR